jgi:predicted HicB family RNase H-like nuclease
LYTYFQQHTIRRMAKRKGNYVAGPGRDSFEKKYGEPARRFALRLPNSLFEAVEAAANREDVSINHFMITLIADAIAQRGDTAEAPGEKDGDQEGQGEE